MKRDMGFPRGPEAADGAGKSGMGEELWHRQTLI